MQTVAAYIKQERKAGRFPAMWVEGAAGLFYLVTNEGQALKGPSYRTRGEAHDAKSKALDRAARRG